MIKKTNLDFLKFGLLPQIRIGDFLLFILLLILSIGGMFYVYGGETNNGNRVIIEVNNIEQFNLPIDVDKVIDLRHLLVEIKDKKVRVKDADCQNKLCVKQGWIDRGSIICLPNRVVIIIKNIKNNHAVIDAISG
ncbi:MAG: NusG domain II-containing protein [Nitrospirae bacterium]|nr:NusG domain II-containing protein [Nitrospirota bacterium]